MTFRIRANAAAIESLVRPIRRIGEAADLIGGAAKAITPPKVRRAQRSLAWIGAASWASLLARVFR